MVTKVCVVFASYCFNLCEELISKNLFSVLKNAHKQYPRRSNWSRCFWCYQAVPVFGTQRIMTITDTSSTSAILDSPEHTSALTSVLMSMFGSSNLAKHGRGLKFAARAKLLDRVLKKHGELLRLRLNQSITFSLGRLCPQNFWRIKCFLSTKTSTSPATL